ncbi:MAG: hypothetical protein IPK28_14570 [Devosia sp.]|nr:hypothetical protein [Devosia sp.]
MRLTRHVTIGDLRRGGALLEFVCSRCGDSRLFDPATLPFGNLQAVATAHRRMHCSVCGWQGAGSFTRARRLRQALAAPSGHDAG